MTIAYNWLAEYIEINESPEEIGKMLTSTGLEVESVTAFETIKGGLQGLVVGEVLSCERHPNADKLTLTTVDVGGEAPLKIVCGAPNVAKGQKVVVALTGATLYPSKGEPFIIKSARIRGEASEGMICAEDEIGLGESHAGIMVLDKGARAGTPAAKYFDIQSDHIFEIGLTPNRADAASHIGVARDIKAVTNRSVKWPAVDSFKVEKPHLNIGVTVENSEGCPRYSALTISNVTVKASPAWLQHRLRSIGLTPINNVVDITNFVCYEVGQPLHAFDADAIKGKKVIVKTLPGGTRFTTLDGKERTLLPTDLMICNAGNGQAGGEEGMCIAGVFGGVGSGIKETTKNIFLESAYFSSTYIRRTSMHHQLKTDASFRFERGTDPNITAYALKRAAMMIVAEAGGHISSDIVDVYPEKIENRSVTVKEKNVHRLIGKEIPRNEVHNILKRLDIEVVENNDAGYTVSVPPYRVDVVQEADVIEEILRIYGLNNIELSNTAKSDYLAEFPVKSIDRYKRSIGELLVANGFYEIWTNSLTNPSYQQKHQLKLEGETVAILNKLSEEQGILRQTMLFTGLEVLAYNLNRKQKDLKLYEFGKIYFKQDGKYREKDRLALYITGNVEAENWQHEVQPSGYYDLAQHVQNIFQKSGIKDIKLEAQADELFEYAASFSIRKQFVGRAGKVRSALLKDFGIKQEIFFAELDSALLFTTANPKLVIQEVAKFPEVKRDLSLVLDAPVIFDEIRNLILNTEKRLIKSIGVFDVYEGENIPKGKKAYALSFTLQDESKTLTDEEIEGTMQRLIAAFENKLGAVIRK
jgi:phenylalanyl-tRNA synthetase beta chain